MFLAYKNNHNGRFLILGIVKNDLPDTAEHGKYGEMIPFGYDIAQRGQVPLVDFIVPICAENEQALMEMLPEVLRSIEADYDEADIPEQRPGDHDREERSNGQLHDLASAAARIRELERQLETERSFGALISTGGSLSDLLGPIATEDEAGS